MKKFSEFIAESNKFNASTLDKLERGILKLNPRKFIKEAEKASKESFYWANRPNFNKWADQQGEGGNSYLVGSDYDLFRNYDYSRASKKVKEHIDKALPMKKMPKVTFNKTWSFNQDGEDHVFKVSLKTNEFPKQALDKFGRVSYKDIIKNMERILNMQVDDKGVFSWNTYRNRKGVSPESAISKKELTTELTNYLKDIWEDINEEVKLRKTMLLVLVDEVIGKDFVYDNREIVEKMKKDLKSAKSVKQFRKTLEDYNFTNIPEDKILKELMASNNFYYSTSRADGYGHETGTEYKINFEKRVITSNGWSSDD